MGRPTSAEPDRLRRGRGGENSAIFRANLWLATCVSRRQVSHTVGRTRANCCRRSISNIQELQIITPPDYLEGKVNLSSKSSPTNLLQDGQWRGHGEPKYSVFDVPVGSENTFSLQLPESDGEALNSPIIMVNLDSGVTFPIYDSRKHPASILYMEDNSESEDPPLQPIFHCPNCETQFVNRYGIK